MPLMTADQIKEYRASVPIHIKRKITEFYNDSTRYAFADTWESGVPRYERPVKEYRIHGEHNSGICQENQYDW